MKDNTRKGSGQTKYDFLGKVLRMKGGIIIAPTLYSLPYIMAIIMMYDAKIHPSIILGATAIPSTIKEIVKLYKSVGAGGGT